MEEIRFSVIIPFYNCGDKIENNVCHLIQQDYHNFEIIFVNDCSTDNSLVYLENLLLNHPSLNCKIYTTETNSGPGVARNIGIKHAKGEYVIFIDADDWIEKDALMKLDKYLLGKEYDLICFDYYKVFNNKKQINKSYFFPYGELSPSKLLSICNNGVTRKLIKKELFQNNKIEFPKWRNGEDIYVEIKLISSSKRILYVNETIYNYFQNINSLSNSKVQDIYFYNKLFNLYCSNTDDNKYLQNRVALDLYYNTITLFLKNKVNCKEIKKYIQTTNERYPNVLVDMDKAFFSKKQYLVIYLAYHLHLKCLIILETIRNMLFSI